MEGQLLQHLLEKHLLSDVVDGDVLGEVEDVGDELRWSTTISRDSIEQRVDDLLLCAAVSFSEIG